MAVASSGEYGAPEGLQFGFPVVADGKGGWTVVEGFEHDEFAPERIAVTTEELLAERSDVKAPGPHRLTVPSQRGIVDSNVALNGTARRHGVRRCSWPTTPRGARHHSDYRGAHAESPGRHRRLEDRHDPSPEGHGGHLHRARARTGSQLRSAGACGAAERHPPFASA